MQHFKNWRGKFARFVRAAPVRVFLILLFGALFASFGTILITGNYQWAGKALGLSEKNDVLTYLGLGMGGILAALQVLILNKRAQAMVDSANAQAEATLNMAKGNQQERFKNAIDHLGNENASVRIAAAHELLHLAENDKNLRDTVLDILCSHIRNTTRSSGYEEKYRTRPSEETQSLIKLITVRSVQCGNIFLGLRANLERSYLNGADFGMASLQEASFIGAKLQRALFYKADLMGAKFFETHMQGIILKNASMQGACIVDADLSGADLSGVQLQGATIGDVTMLEVNLNGAQLQGVRGWTPDSNEYYYRFMSNIMKASDKESDLSGITFGGTVQQEDIESFVRNKGATIGTYTAKDAGKWLSEFGIWQKNLEQAISGEQEDNKA